MSGEVWCARVVGLIPMPEIGVVSEAVFGPFYDPVDASDFADRYRDEWSLVQTQVMRIINSGAVE